MDTLESKLITNDINQNKIMKKIDFIIGSMPCISTQSDLQYLFNQLKAIQNPSIKWITK